MNNAKTLRKIVTFRPDGCSGIPDGPYSECCNEHDFYYVYRGKYQWLAYRNNEELVAHTEPLRRVTADRILHECMKRHEDPLFSKFVYLGVRAFGWIFWYDIAERFQRRKRMLFDLMVLTAALGMLTWLIMN